MTPTFPHDAPPPGFRLLWSDALRGWGWELVQHYASRSEWPDDVPPACVYGWTPSDAVDAAWIFYNLHGEQFGIPVALRADPVPPNPPGETIAVLDGHLDAAGEALAEEANQTQRAYHERNRVAILAAALARQLGLRVGVYDDPIETDERFRKVLQIDLPSGQIRFHLDQSDQGWTVFSPTWEMVPDYDGHDDDDVWRRIERFVCGVDVRTSDDVVVGSFRVTVANLELQLERVRSQRIDTGRMFVKAREDYQRLRVTVTEFKRMWLTDLGDIVGAVRMGAEGPSGDNLQDWIEDRWKKAEKLADEAMRETEGS